MLGGCRTGVERTPPPRSDAYLAGERGGEPVPSPVPRSAGVAAEPPPAVPPASAPAAPEGRNVNLDEMLAFVEGHVITRRSIERELGARAPTQDERDYEMSVANRLRERVKDLVFVKAAERLGLSVPPDMLDRAVAEQSEDEARAASKRTGRTVTFEEILAERGQTKAEYRDALGNVILIRNFFHILFEGIPGKRAVIDIEPSPAEVLRLYEAHRAEFDVKPGARIAWWIVPTADFLKPDSGCTTYEQAVAAAKRRVIEIVGAVRAGASPEQAAERFQIELGAWGHSALVDEGRLASRLPAFYPGWTRAKDMVAWAYDPARRAGDAASFVGPRDNPMGVYVVEVRAARSRPFSEVREEIYDVIRGVRRQRAIYQTLLDNLPRASIQPPLLRRVLEEEARTKIAEIDANPVQRDVKLR